jgi:quercetin dioxygenase-like cupin family protein
MEKINENEVPAKYGTWGSRYLFNGKNYSMGTAYITPGNVLPEHAHADEIELFYFISGTPLFTVNGQSFRVKPGDAFQAGVNEPHRLENDTLETIHMNFIKLKAE